jgi:hypothetical protein
MWDVTKIPRNSLIPVAIIVTRAWEWGKDRRGRERELCREGLPDGNLVLS